MVMETPNREFSPSGNWGGWDPRPSSGSPEARPNPFGKSHGHESLEAYRWKEASGSRV